MVLSVQVNEFSGHACTVCAEPGWMVLQVKQAISADLGIRVCDQRLILGSVELKNTETLEDFSQNASSIALSLIRRPAGQAKWMLNLKASAASLASAPENIRADRELVLIAVERNPLELEYAVDDLRADVEVVMKAASKNLLALRFASLDLREDRDFVLAILQCSMLSCRDQVCQYESGLQRKYVQPNCVLQCLPNSLAGDPEIVLAAMDSNWTALEYAVDVWSGPEFFLTFLDKCSSSLECVEADAWKDLHFISAATVRHWKVYSCAPHHIQMHWKIILRVLVEDWHVLELAASRHVTERSFEFCRSHTAKVKPVSLETVADELKADRAFVLAAVAENGRDLQYAASEILEDRSVILAAVARDGRALEYVGHNFRGDRDIVLTAVSNDSRALQFASESLREDIEVVLAAVRANNEVFRFAADELLYDSEFSMLGRVVEHVLSIRASFGWGEEDGCCTHQPVEF
eukprot:TRINITY_DN49798_c0_g1_i1.p1 TRINITY_DN49798_c0_g1~~TRINITY_DN49798_c0_g1_i1.p1  ORF type:complete len:464 (+),score=58.44 TRINITY_DN49798_c0_g1_i1:142-1533(+)